MAGNESSVSLGSLNPFGNFSVGNLGTFGNIALVIAIAVVILMLAGVLVYIYSVRKQYYLRIHVFRLVGNVPTRVAIYSAKEVPFGMAGDKLWRVASAGALKFKVIKWLPVGKLQTASNEFWYWLREDGEWINFIQTNIDETSKKMGVRFVQEDMRLQRLATERLLEQRLLNKSFWDKWGNTIMTIIVFLVVAICMVVIFWQFSKILDKFTLLLDPLQKSLEITQQICKISLNQTQTGGSGLIPATA